MSPDMVSDLLARDRRCVWHPYAALPPEVEPLVVVAASGASLELADGRQMIDGMSSWWAAIHGYRHPILDAAVQAQLESMSHVMLGGLTHAGAVELAERLIGITPTGLDHVFFCDSGSVSVEVAMKMAIQYWQGRGRPERARLLTVRSGYHGDTFGAMSVCDPETGMHSMFTGLLAEQIFAPSPSPEFGGALTDADLSPLLTLLDRHLDQIAAVILEPVVQGAGGMRFYSPDYLAAVARLCSERGILLIADEIATGFGRTGTLFGCDHAAVSPDILCLGKALTGGYMSMAATLCSAEVAAGVGDSPAGALMHGPTFMANPLAAAVSIASIDLLLGQPWAQTVAGIADRLTIGLGGLEASEPVADVRVRGAIGVVEMKEPLDPQRGQRVLSEGGVWLRPFGKLLYTMPPYVSSDAQVDAITKAMRAVVEDLA